MAETTAAPARSDRGAGRMLFVLSGNMVLDSIEVSLVLVALPSIAADLRLSLWTVQWLMSGFALGFAAVLLVGPRLTARWGLRRCYLVALLVFALASVAGGLSDTTGLLIASRVVKGGCAALTAPAGLTLIGATFPDGPQLRRAVSVYSLFGASGFTLGLLLSGVLTPVSWRWTFLFPAPVALLLFARGLRVIPRTARGSAAPRPAPVLRGHRAPIRATLVAACLNGTYASLLLLITFRVTGQYGWEPWQTALALLPACVPLALSAAYAGRLAARFGTRGPVAAGAAAAFAGQLLLLLRPGTGSYAAVLLPTLLLVGIAFVLAFGALNLQVTQGLTPLERGAAVPLYQTGVQLGGVLLLPPVGALLTHGGDRAALLTIALAGAAGLAVALTGLRGPSTSGSQPT
ncbi:MFS transporter [Streptomyces sp. NPDC001904]|uniref:MFS transporter n=1 Tax=Streptomyces sp. NPDC001904 TaxID=3154531 RepID=UPI0033292BB8